MAGIIAFLASKLEALAFACELYSKRAGGCGAWVFETPHFACFTYRMTFKILKP